MQTAQTNSGHVAGGKTEVAIAPHECDSLPIAAFVAEAHRRIVAALPEDEPDCVPDWVCELLIRLGMEWAAMICDEYVNADGESLATKIKAAAK